MQLRRMLTVAGMIPLVATGCSSSPAIGPGVAYEPDDREQRLWEYADRASEAMQSSGSVIHDEKLRAYVQRVLERVLGDNLSAYVPLHPQVFILDSPLVNAFALPNGHIYVNSGLLGRIRNEAQLAMLLGHEITHATHRHSDQRADMARGTSDVLAYVAVLSSYGGENVYNAVSGLGGVLNQAAVSGYGRDKESEADEVGLTLIAQAGYDPEEGPKLFQRMMETAKPRKWVALYASHPKMRDRWQSCRRLISDLHPELVAGATDIGQDRYLAAAAPMIYDEVRVHVSEGRFDTASETLEFMRKERPSDPLAPALLGEVHATRGDPGDLDLARTAYATAISRDSNCGPAHRGLGLLEMKSGNNTSALTHLRNYLLVNPDAPDAPMMKQYITQLQAAE